MIDTLMEAPASAGVSSFAASGAGLLFGGLPHPPMVTG